MIGVLSMVSRRCLDLCCGVGLASWGYWASGCFSEVVGVDCEQQLAYSFDFIQADALTLTYEFLSQFDFIHCSPPCQAYSKQTPAEYKKRLPRLILPFKHLLYASGVPHVVENVEGSGRELRPNVCFDGRRFDLPMMRRRYFYVSTLEAAGLLNSFVPAPQVRTRRNINVNSGQFVSRADVVEAFGLEAIVSNRRLPNMSVPAIKQGIPPAMTRAIAWAHFDKVKVG